MQLQQQYEQESLQRAKSLPDTLADVVGPLEGSEARLNVTPLLALSDTWSETGPGEEVIGSVQAAPGRVRVETHFDLRRHAEQVEAVYAEVLRAIGS